MAFSLLEKLPNGQLLYQAELVSKEGHLETVVPGQWLEIDGLLLPIFHCNKHLIQFIAPEEITLSGNFSIVGEPLLIPDNDNKLLLVAENQGVPMLFFLVHFLRQQWGTKKFNSRFYQILLGTKSGFPFQPVPSQIMMPQMPPEVIASAPLLEDLGLAARLASGSESPGCYSGSLAKMITEINFDNFSMQPTTVITLGSKQLLDAAKDCFHSASNTLNIHVMRHCPILEQDCH